MLAMEMRTQPSNDRKIEAYGAKQHLEEIIVESV
jgi:hypothetical protein